MLTKLFFFFHDFGFLRSNVENLEIISVLSSLNQICCQVKSESPLIGGGKESDPID